MTFVGAGREISPSPLASSATQLGLVTGSRFALLDKTCSAVRFPTQAKQLACSTRTTKTPCVFVVRVGRIELPS